MRKITILFIWYSIAVLQWLDVSGAVVTNLTKIPKPQPYKMASFGKFELFSSSPGVLTNEIRISPEGEIERFKFVKNSNVCDGLRIKLPINYFSWNEFSLRFKPESDGEITLLLSGPYEENTNGVYYREENLWDKIEIAGAEIINGSFEDVKGNQPVGWISKGGVANSGPMPPFEGRYYARTSFNRTLETQFKVKKDSKVTLTIYARSIPSPAENVMRRIISKTTQAHSLAKKFTRGVNLTRFLELNPEENFNEPYIHTDFQMIKSEGFDHIRIPVGFHYYAEATNNYTLNPIIFSKIETVITNAFLNDLNVILCWSNFDGFRKDPLKNTNIFFKVWKQISEYYNLYPENLAFELIDSPPSSIDDKSLYLIYKQSIELIRELNHERVLFVDAPEGSVKYLGKLNLPYDDNNLIVSVKLFEPLYFTHQGLAVDGMELKKLSGIVFPAPPSKPLVLSLDDLPHQAKAFLAAYNNLPAEVNPCSKISFLHYIKIAKQWSEYFGRPIYFAGFGVSATADENSRAKYYSQFRKTLEESNIGWAIYDWKFEFRYFDAAKNQPMPGLHNALFGKE
ncbi:MAG: glycoside hydrolase family 5 protein [Verrucomicrobiia bacterium]|jgi:hypothetical protein